MNKIRTIILNPESVVRNRKMMAFAARITQRGHELHDVDSVMRLYNESISDGLIKSLTNLPHPTLQKFETIDVVVIGASGRFLRQITRHQNEVKFMSGSLQYSDFSNTNDEQFVVPYEVLRDDSVFEYLCSCRQIMSKYEEYAEELDNDAAGYLAPNALRNILLISATPYQWKHMIGQRICRRNTTETRYVMLQIWRTLYGLDPIMFSTLTTGAACQRDHCNEGKMSCKNPITEETPSDIIRKEFPLLYYGTENN